MNYSKPEKVVKVATIGIVIYLLCFGIAMAFFPIRPFWNDEWRLLYNIKFKTIPQLWGTLDLLQECPRVYLTMLKLIAANFDYSYISVRLPPLIIGTLDIFFIFYLKKKIYPNGSVFSNLFVLILISSQTFTDYIVQVKQYEMEIFLCLLVLWQLITLLEISEQKATNNYRYLLLCFSFLVAPFFGYTYPISVAPVFPVIVFSSIMSLRKTQRSTASLLPIYLSLAIVSASIVVFYCIDVKHLLQDNSMYLSYKKYCYHADKETFIEDFWKLFALVGSGDLYEIIFGTLGISAFFYGIYRLVRMKKTELTTENYLTLYAVILLILILLLFLMEKLLGGVARLTSFAVPAISILIISLLEKIKTRYAKPANLLAAILFLGLFGNIISTFINRFTYREYNSRIRTYWHTSEALKLARVNKVPLLFTDAVRGSNDGIKGDQPEQDNPAPGKISANTITPEQIRGADTLCAEAILKVNPEYKVWQPVPVYLIPDTKWAHEYVQQLPSGINAAVVTNGIRYMMVKR